MIQLLPSSLLALLPMHVLLAQTDYETTAPAAPSPIVWVCYFVVIILLIAAMWKVFSKAGQPGWAAIIPIFNMYVLCKVAGRPGWWVILMLIPFVNFIILIIVSIDIARNFGKGVGFGIGLFLLPFIFYPILGFGGAQYQGGGASAPATII
jgi:hypothetical protein